MKDTEILERIGLPKQFLTDKKFEASKVTFDKDTVLFKPGDHCRLFLIVLEGSVRVELTARQGRDTTLYRINSGESCVLTTTSLLNSEKYYAQGITETEVTALAITTASFNNVLLEYPLFMQYVLSDYSKKVSLLFVLIDRLTSNNILSNVANFLYENKDEDNTLTIKQSALAREIGTAREVVGRKLIELEKSNVIRRERSEIKIVDLNKLEEILL